MYVININKTDNTEHDQKSIRDKKKLMMKYLNQRAETHWIVMF